MQYIKKEATIIEAVEVAEYELEKIQKFLGNAEYYVRYKDAQFYSILISKDYLSKTELCEAKAGDFIINKGLDPYDMPLFEIQTLAQFHAVYEERYKVEEDD